jgi:hypothetical protein
VAGVTSIERPFIERDLDRATADQDAGRHQDRERLDIALRQAEPHAVAHQKSMEVQESEGEAETVPPQAYAATSAITGSMSWT